MQKEIDIKPLTDRVVVNSDGLAVRSDRAFHEYGVISRVIFVRGDGFAVGAPNELESVAYGLWSGSWREFRRWPDYAPRPIDEYAAAPKGKR
jgi:hypothetical protein